MDIGWAGRDASPCSDITVPCVTLANLFGEFGVPYYLKIDVEGVDGAVLEQLQGNALLPQYVSVEDCRFGFQYMEILASCGYDAFKLLDQSTVCTMTDPVTGRLFPAGSSGPFGNDVPGQWLSYTDGGFIRQRCATGKAIASPRAAYGGISTAQTSESAAKNDATSEDRKF